MLRGDRAVIWPMAHPIAAHFDVPELYWHGTKLHYRFATRIIEIGRNGSFLSNSYMNAFPYQKWREHAAVGDLTLNVKYRGGEAYLNLFGELAGRRSLIASEFLPKSLETRQISISVPRQRDDIVLLTCEIEAAEKTELLDLHYTTNAETERKLSLAIVITTFNRPEDLADALRTLSGIDDYPFRISVYVVNNGRPLKGLPEDIKINVIENRNLGGAGGFSRGLYEIEKIGEFSHVMFMDDDALCHPISIYRTLQFLSFSKHQNAAVSGAMLYTEHPGLQYELGARAARYGLESVNQNFDLRDFQNVLRNESADPLLFGPWWYFVFPISQVSRLPFPFFVRGDDVAFSLQNNFELFTLPSVGSWQPSFEYKINAATEYLATRSFVALPVTVDSSHWTKDMVIAGFCTQFQREVASYRYAIGEAMLAALEDVMSGPDFWRSEANTVARLGRLRVLEAEATARAQLDAPVLTDFNKIGRQCGRVWWKLQRMFGVMSRFKFRKAGLTHNMWPQPVEAAARRGMIYSSPDGVNRFSCRYERKWEKSLNARCLELTLAYRERFEDLRAEYEAARDSLQGVSAWEEKFSVKP